MTNRINPQPPQQHLPISKRYYAVIALVNGKEVPQMWKYIHISLGSKVVNGVSCKFVRLIN